MLLLREATFDGAETAVIARAQASVKSPPKLEDEGRGNRKRERERGNAMLLAGVFDKVQASMSPVCQRERGRVE